MASFPARSVLCLCACLLALPTHAQKMKLADDELNEQFEDRSTEISGALLVGVQRSRAGDAGLTIGALLPEGWEQGSTCLRIVTANGRYEVAETYILDEDGGAGGRLFDYPYPTTMGDWLRQLGGDEIAALATPGDCTQNVADIPEQVAISAWDGATGGPVDLLVNALGASQVYLYVGDRPGAIPCAPVLGEILSAYDTVCTVPEDALLGSEIPVRLLRVENRQPGRPVAFRLVLPAG